MAHRVDLTANEEQFLLDLLDWWSEGQAEAMSMTVEDGSLALDELLKATAGLDEQVRMCATIRGKLRERDHSS
jgi:hypothetical protein